MVCLKSALHLLELIENRKYADAATVTKDVDWPNNSMESISVLNGYMHSEDSYVTKSLTYVGTVATTTTKPVLSLDDMRGFVPNLIYKTAYSFGNESSVHLKALLEQLFVLLTSVQQKYRLCYELLTLRTSAPLTEVLLSQLELLISTHLQHQYPDLLNQICNELPMKLERRLCERLSSKDEDTWFRIVEAAHVLAFFDRITVRIPYKFAQLVDRVLGELTSEETAAYPFLRWHAKEHPFSPKLLGHTKPTVLIPSVYDQQYFRLRLVEGIREYIIDSDPQNNNVVKSLINALQFLLKLSNDCQECHVCHIKLYTEMFVALLRFIDCIGVQAHQNIITKMSENIISYFPMQLRVLLLKNIVTKIISEVSFCLMRESKTLAWLLDQFEHHLNENVFVSELGSLLGLLENVICDSVASSTSFYLSLLRIARSYTRICVSTSVLAEIRERIVVRLHGKLLEHMELDVVKTSITTNADPDVFINHACLPSGAAEKHFRHLIPILRECEETMVGIDNILSYLKVKCG